MESTKCLVLNSGGIDSTTCLGIAIEKFGKENVSTVSFIYGQRHFKELNCAQKIAEHYGVNHYVLNIADIMKYSDSAMLAGGKDVPLKTYEEQIKEKGEGAVDTYVPFRNGLMLSAVSALALSIYPNDRVDVYIGVHEGDTYGNSYADCSKAFISHMKAAIDEGCYHKVNVVAPLLEITPSNKANIIKKGLELNVPYNLTWSCYLGGDKACGKCGTCKERLAGFEANGAKDPIEYEEE